MVTEQRSTKEEIFAHLTSLLEKEASVVAVNSSAEFTAGHKSRGMSILSDYDSKLGGFGIYAIQDEIPVGIYRALYYVLLPLQKERPDDASRGIIYSSCCYLEELLKKMARVWPWEEINADWLPLGKLTYRAKKRIPSPIYDELTWLSRSVYNFAKHHYNLENNCSGEPKHYFGLDEAIAVYLIVRKLGIEIESMIDPSKLRTPTDR